MTKQELREKIKGILSSLPGPLREQKSSSIAANLFISKIWQEADAVFLFLSFDTEVMTDVMVQRALSEDKIVAIPCIAGGGMTFHRIMGLYDSISVNEYGIREPCRDLPQVKIGNNREVLVVTPGLAFDRNKNRLGRGGGYYDRFIAKARSKTGERVVFAGICFTEQITAVVPVNSHDMKVDIIVTDRGIIP
jgi:5-formyltetrahydrofolate cyclo-ligase